MCSNSWLTADFVPCLLLVSFPQLSICTSMSFVCTVYTLLENACMYSTYHWTWSFSCSGSDGLDAIFALVQIAETLYLPLFLTSYICIYICIIYTHYCGLYRLVYFFCVFHFHGASELSCDSRSQSLIPWQIYDQEHFQVDIVSLSICQ